MERKEVYNRIDGERDYQDSKWTEREQQRLGFVPDDEKSVAEWILYIENHLNKAKNNVYYLNEGLALDEIRKVAALAVRTMEIHGCPSRKNPIEIDK